MKSSCTQKTTNFLKICPHNDCVLQVPTRQGQMAYKSFIELAKKARFHIIIYIMKKI